MAIEIAVAYTVSQDDQRLVNILRVESVLPVDVQGQAVDFAAILQATFERMAAEGAEQATEQMKQMHALFEQADERGLT